LVGAFDHVNEVPSDPATTVDSIQPASGAPGSTEFSGHDALNLWWDNDQVTHVTTPKPDLAYLIKRASGGYAKLRFTNYDSGTVTVEVAVLSE